jgi:phage gp45-like
MPFSFQDIAIRVMNLAVRGVIVEQDTKKKFPYHTIDTVPGIRTADVEDFSQRYGMAHVVHPEQKDGKELSLAENTDIGKADGNDKRKSSEVIVLCLGGDPNHSVIIANNDRRFYPHDSSLDQDDQQQSGATSGHSAGGAQPTALAASTGQSGQGGQQSKELKNLKPGEWCLYDDQGHQIHCTRGGITFSMPNDKNVTMRLMHAKAGTPGKPSNEVQSYKNDPSKDVAHSITMDKGGMTLNSKGAITHNILNQDGSVKSSHTLDQDGFRTNIAGDVKHENKGSHTTVASQNVGVQATGGTYKLASGGKQHTDLATLDESASARSLGESGPHKKLIYKVG